MPPQTGITAQLKDALQLTRAVWVVHAEREGGIWLIRAAQGLTKPAQNTLQKYISQESVDAWLSGSLTSGHSRSAVLSKDSDLNVPYLVAFPINGLSQVVLVGGSRLQVEKNKKIWFLFAALLSNQSEACSDTLLPELQTGVPYDLSAVNGVLSAFINASSCAGGWLAIRRGESLDIQAEWNDKPSKGKTLAIDSNSHLKHLSRTLAEVAVERDNASWNLIPPSAPKGRAHYWSCIPLVVGQRLIGVVALWRIKPFTAQEWKSLRKLAVKASSSVDVILAFTEMSAHLRRLGMLNDFALTVSSAYSLEQIARRVVSLLARAFSKAWVTLYLPSIDKRIIHEFRMHNGKFSAQVVSMAGHPVAAYLSFSRIQRLNDPAATVKLPSQPKVKSSLLVPLRYRNKNAGLMLLESDRSETFSQPDEHLIVVIASHLAGLIEYGRVREEAEGRAKNLGLIHEVVQQIIGVVNKLEVAQITAFLLAQYFGYELTAVLLVDSRNSLSIQGFAGTRATEVKRSLAEDDFNTVSGITGYVFSTGESKLVNDVSLEPLYHPIKGWSAASEMCVALKDAGRTFGIIDIESSEKNAFTNNDLLAIESLAGILATVVASADQYQRLQETIRQHRMTQMELKARMDAQQAAESRLVQAAKLAAVGEMAAGIAHELNNPLTTVTGFAELILKDASESSSYHDELEMILREARRARDVVRRLLDFSRQSEQTRTRADFNEVLSDVIALTQHLIRTNNVQLSVEMANELPWVYVDRNHMKQVLLNLIHNALQAMPVGGRLDITTAPKDRDGKHWVTLAIRDTGVGIAPKDRERIFEPFYTTKGDKGGTGLGLSVTYGIVTDHSGQIDVESVPDEGSCFTVWLPIQEMIG